MFGTKHSKTNLLQKTIECKTNEQYKTFVLKYANRYINRLRLVLAVFASTKLVSNYITRAQCN